MQMGKRSFHVLPLRVGNVPCHIVLDTTAFCQGTGTQIPPTMTPAAKISVWSRMIRPTMRPFLRGPKHAPICVFGGEVCTEEGVSLSATLVRVDLQDVASRPGASEFRAAAKAAEAEHPRSPVAGLLHVEQHADEFKAKLAGRDYVVVDPGKRDLHYARSAGDSRRTLRCTNAQRKHMGRQSSHKALRAKEHLAAGVVGGRTVPGWKAYVAECNPRTVDPVLFKQCTERRVECLRATSQHYQQPLFRLLELDAKRNKQRHLDLYLRDFERTFGGPDEAVVVIGDWATGTAHLPHNPPTLRRGLLGALRHRGYDVWLVDEFRTTKSCSTCHAGDCDHCITWKLPDGREAGYVHNLLRCGNCRTYHNRNRSATRNMLRIVKAALRGGERPADLRRREAAVGGGQQ